MLAHDFLKKEERSVTSRSSSQIGLLTVAKFLRCVGIFSVDILSRSIHVVSLLWFFKLIASCVLVPVQKPFTHGKSIRKSLLVRIAQLSLFHCLIETIWFYGITFCGPLRAVLVFEQSPAVVLAAVLTIVKGGGGPAKSRGVFCVIVGFLTLIIMDSDSTIQTIHTESHTHHSGLNHLFYHVINWFGLADHKGGVILLIFALLAKIGYDASFRHLSVDVGGPKRLYALVTLVSSFILMPFAVLALFTGGIHIDFYFQFIILLIATALFVMVIDFYLESFCLQHAADPVLAASRWSPVIMFLWAFGLAWFWFRAPSQQLFAHHDISPGVIVTLICFSTACFVLTASNSQKTTTGQFVGMSDLGLPLYTYGEAFLQKTSRSMFLFLKETLHEILGNSDSRRIFWFLCANLAFCGVEFLYGFWTNSLGLLSDGFHMLFDCSALVMGLVASVMARWTATRLYSYGYGRVEVLSGFINALFLIVIAFFIFLEALERLYDPPDIHTEKLMFVAVAGLLVNLFGMYAFHGSGHGHSHGGGADHGHSHGGANANMQGVFLHVLADTLGSVFVIISTLLIEWFGWQWVDPLCSLILSLLILSSVAPLLRASASTLLQSVPADLDHQFEHVLDQILQIDGVLSYSRPHFWQLKSELNVASIHVQINETANAQIVRQAIGHLLRNGGAAQYTVQVEKQSFLQRIVALCPSYRLPPTVSAGRCDGGHGHSHGMANGYVTTVPNIG